VPPPLDLVEKLLRLGAAVLAGVVVGLNRDLHGKPAGVRTHALVALGAALITVVTAELMPASDGGIPHVFQGIITGVGFLGAGVILHREEDGTRVRGLTTAASIWIIACIGAASGAGRWGTVLLGTALTLLVLFAGGGLERLAEKVFTKRGGKTDDLDNGG
jgi:putative Mg2+ transporter-C (MgtC) family protein